MGKELTCYNKNAISCTQGQKAFILYFNHLQVGKKSNFLLGLKSKGSVTWTTRLR